jgi:hypothetical protein
MNKSDKKTNVTVNIFSGNKVSFEGDVAKMIICAIIVVALIVVSVIFQKDISSFTEVIRSIFSIHIGYQH